MAFTDTNPKIGDSDNNLLFKIAQALSSGVFGGSGDSLWQFSGGSIHPITANRSITSYSSNFIANPGAADGSPILAVNSTATHSSGNLFLIANNGTPKLSITTDGGIVSDGGATLNGALSAASGTAVLNGEVADGNTAHLFDTSVAHVLQDNIQPMVSVKNHGTQQFGIGPKGEIHIGSSTDADAGGYYGESLKSRRDTANGDDDGNGLFLSVVDGTSNSTFGLQQFSTSSTLTMTRTVSGATNELRVLNQSAGLSLNLFVASNLRTQLKPNGTASTTAYIFDTSVNHTSNLLVDFLNLGVSKASLGFDGAFNAVSYKVGGVAGASGTITAASTVTVVNGIITVIA